MDLKLTTAHDLDFSTGDLVLLTGTDAIAQDCEVRLQFFLGEWFLDNRLGVPWFQRILGQKPKLQAVSEILQRAALSTPGLESLSNWELDYEGTTRTLSISFVGHATDGDFEFNTELIV